MAGLHYEDFEVGRVFDHALRRTRFVNQIDRRLVDARRIGQFHLGYLTARPIAEFLIQLSGQRFQIGNNRGGINGWVGPQAIFGKAIKVER